MPQWVNSEWGLVGSDRVLGFILHVTGAIVGFVAMDLCYLTCIFHHCCGIGADNGPWRGKGGGKETLGSRWKLVYHLGDGKEMETWTRVIVMEDITAT